MPSLLQGGARKGISSLFFNCKSLVQPAHNHWLVVSSHEMGDFSAFTHISNAHQHALELQPRSASLVRPAKLQHNVTPVHQQFTHHKPSCVS